MIDTLTVCITSFRRPKHLERAIRSVWEAGIQRVTIAAVAATDEVSAVIRSARTAYDWTSFDVTQTDDDVGCNETWILALYLARTSRVIVLHDDDVLLPEFRAVFSAKIVPFLDRGGRLVSWQADLILDSGHRTPCSYWPEKTPGIHPATDLLEMLLPRGRLSLSPIVSILDRETTIHACKEAGQALTDARCTLRPGMLLGTEILAYLRNVDRVSLWLYLDNVLAGYGDHLGSGTKVAEAMGDLSPLTAGYDIAREQGETFFTGYYLPRTILVTTDMRPRNEEESWRFQRARASWRKLSDVVEIPISLPPAQRTGNIMAITDILDEACARALPEDRVMFVNQDCGIDHLPAVCGRGSSRAMVMLPRLNFQPGNNPMTGEEDQGIDGLVMSPGWWAENRHRFPRMFVGRAGWDPIFAHLCAQRKEHRILWHEAHGPTWQILSWSKSHRMFSASCQHNRRAEERFWGNVEGPLPRSGLEIFRTLKQETKNEQAHS